MGTGAPLAAGYRYSQLISAGTERTPHSFRRTQRLPSRAVPEELLLHAPNLKTEFGGTGAAEPRRAPAPQNPSGSAPFGAGEALWGQILSCSWVVLEGKPFRSTSVKFPDCFFFFFFWLLGFCRYLRVCAYRTRLKEHRAVVRENQSQVRGLAAGSGAGSPRGAGRPLPTPRRGGQSLPLPSLLFLLLLLLRPQLRGRGP